MLPVGLQMEELEPALASLASWGNLRADVDTSRVTTIQDFYRPRHLFQLTREGEAAEVALEAYERALGAPGELQSVALEDIRVRIRSLLQQAATAEPDPGVVHGTAAGADTSAGESRCQRRSPQCMSGGIVRRLHERPLTK